MQIAAARQAAVVVRKHARRILPSLAEMIDIYRQIMRRVV
jgi:hypothetical protein